MGAESYNSKGNSQNENIANSQEGLLDVPEVDTLVHVKPENGGQSNYKLISIGTHCKEQEHLQLNQLPNNAL